MQFLGSWLICERGKLTLEKSSGHGFNSLQINSKAHSTSAGIGHNWSFPVKQSQSMGAI